MKILYVTGTHGPDYLMDSVLHGLKVLYGDDVVDSPCLRYMYKPYTSDRRKARLYGRGFTLYAALEHDGADRTDIEGKIKARYFDLVIYGAFPFCQEHLALVNECYPPGRIVALDGRDWVREGWSVYCSLKYPYFKRELTERREGVFPISLSIPASKILREPVAKIKKFGTLVPGDKTTYTFYDEATYYRDYAESCFGITRKRSGWDCLRHYEIIAANCMPHFVRTDSLRGGRSMGIEDCPDLTMARYPKGLCVEANQLVEQDPLDETAYYELLARFTEHLRAYLTTERVAEYLIGTVNAWAIR